MPSTKSLILSVLLYIFRYKQRSVIKLAARFRTTSATSITALSAINDFYSRILCSL